MDDHAWEMEAASHSRPAPGRLNIAAIGGGVSGLPAAWLLSHRRRVTLFEADSRVRGHSHAVDAGFIVYNEATYPNLVALFRHLVVPVRPTVMSFAVSLDGGRHEYGSDLGTLVAQPGNMARRRFWSMLRDLIRFYRRRRARSWASRTSPSATTCATAGTAGSPRRSSLSDGCGCLVDARRRDRRLSCRGFRPVLRQPRPAEAERKLDLCLAQSLGDGVRTGRQVLALRRHEDGVEVTVAGAGPQRFHHVVVAAHADQALALLADPSAEEARFLGAFRYTANRTVLHADLRLIPRRRRVWSSWNYLAPALDAEQPPSLTYWMNRLQGIPQATPRFVSLNPPREPERIF